MKAFVLILAVAACMIDVDANWGYAGTPGVVLPSNWSIANPLCGGSKQSPINIVSSSSQLDSNLGHFQHSLFQAPQAMHVTNNGHTLHITINGAYTIQNTALLPATYKPEQFHIHWAKPNSAGSEHTLDGYRYFGELHIVHYNTLYANVGAAKTQVDGLAVLAFFIQSGPSQDNVAFNDILIPVRSGALRAPDSTHTYASTVALSSVMPTDISAYYRYKGSLTTPTCDENVIWTVFRNPIHISQAQATALQTMIMSRHNTYIGGNYRPTQNLNSRAVYHPPASAAPTSLPASCFHLITLCAMALLLTST